MKKVIFSLVLLSAVAAIGTTVVKNGAILSELSKLVYDKSNQTRIFRIGVVLTEDAYQQAFDGLKYQLEREGYQDNKNLAFIVRDIRGNTAKLPEAIKSLLEENPDLIYSISTSVTAKARELADSDIPIVFNAVDDPLGARFIKSYALPGTNLTGCSNISTELSGKRLEIFQEAFPEIKRVVTFYNPENTSSKLSADSLKLAAIALGIELREFETRNINDLKDVLVNIKPGEYDGIYIVPDAMIISNIKLIIQKSSELKVPTMAHEQTLAEQGISLTYGANFYDLGSQCAPTIVSILSGQKSGNIPVITPSRLDIIVNLKQIKKIGLDIDPAIASEANKIIF